MRSLKSQAKAQAGTRPIAAEGAAVHGMDHQRTPHLPAEAERRWPRAVPCRQSLSITGRIQSCSHPYGHPPTRLQAQRERQSESRAQPPHSPRRTWAVQGTMPNPYRRPARTTERQEVTSNPREGQHLSPGHQLHLLYPGQLSHCKHRFPP